MNKYFLSIVLVSLYIVANAQQKVKLYTEQEANKLTIYADNSEACPVSMKVDFTVKNLVIEGGNNKTYVLEPNKARQPLTTLTPEKANKSTQMSLTYSSNFGNSELTEYDEDFNYYLPFPKNESYKITQGYDGKFSHKNENSIDFDMPEGSEITASRGGTVIRVVDSNSKGCLNPACKEFNNSIIIYHSDGTFAVYAHIKKRGSVVKEGEQVTIGQKIGYSGNVGYSQGPHLHLTIYQQKLDKIVSLKTKFLVNDGEIAEELKERELYKRAY